MDEPVITQQRIREVAYLLWEAAGKPEGSANRYWAQAEQQLREDAKSDEVPDEVPAANVPDEPPGE